MVILFLDIDGVLNSKEYYLNNYDRVLAFMREHHNYADDINICFKRKMLDIDMKAVAILKEVVDITGAKIVLTSSLKTTIYYPLFVSEFSKMGIPIIGKTLDEVYNRGYGIKQYIINNGVKVYVILDDDIFQDYDEELLLHLVKTRHDTGLKEVHKEEMLRKIREKC